MKRGMTTPWGAADSVTLLASMKVNGKVVPLMWGVSTAGHGGIRLSEEGQAVLRECVYDAAAGNFLGSLQWWEEDCDWAVPVYVFWPLIAKPGEYWSGDLTREKCYLYCQMFSQPKSQLTAIARAVQAVEAIVAGGQDMTVPGQGVVKMEVAAHV